MKRFLFLIVMVAALIGLVAWRFMSKAKDSAALAQNAPGRQAQVVILATAGPREIDQTIDAVGSIDTPFNVKLSPNVAGPISYLQVREGDSVTVGETLVRIDPAELEAEVLQQASAVAEAKQRLVQAQLTQNPNNVGVQSQIEQMRAGLNSSEADYGQIRANLAAQVGAQQQVVVDNQSKVAAAQAQVNNALAGLNSAQASYVNANGKYERYETLYKQGMVAAQDVDDQRTTADVAKAAVNVAQAQVDSARSALKSAQAELTAAEKQLAVVRLQGISNVAASKAKLDQAKATLKLAVSNTANVPAYQANIDALKATYDSTVALLKQAQARLTYTDIKSSIDGVVTARAADPGSIATPGNPVLTIQFLKWVYLTTTIPVEFSHKVYVGQTATFGVDALPGQTFTAKVAYINLVADPLSHQFMVRFKVDNPGYLLRPGMYARVHLVSSRVDARVVVPREAVTTANAGGSTVTIAVPSTTKGQYTAHIVPVKLGVQDPIGIQITDGVEAGDQVVIQSYSTLKEGQKMRTGPPPGAAGSSGAGSGRRGGGKSGAGGSGGGSGAADAGAGASVSAPAAGGGGTGVAGSIPADSGTAGSPAMAAPGDGTGAAGTGAAGAGAAAGATGVGK